MLSSSFLFTQVRIDTNFESGSVGSYKITDSVTIPSPISDSLTIIQIDISSRFDPVNPVDSSLSPSARWYYFRLTGVKNKVVYLKIKNSEVIRPFFSYDNEQFERFSADENSTKGRVVKYFEQDTVYICHYIPYTYSRMQAKVAEWKQNQSVKISTIGKSHDGLEIPMLKITDKKISDKKKKVIWIHGRSHPSESPASWHLESLVNQILADNKYAQEIREKAIFYVVPFINPDGVFGGFSRSSSTGVNLEINWDRPDSLTMPEVKILKKTVDSLRNRHEIELFLNMHSQIANSVTYWIHDAQSTTNDFFRKQLLLSNLTANDSPYYSSEDQSFSQVAPRYAEGWIWTKAKEKTLAITFETPYTYYRENPEIGWVSTENLSQLATSSLNAITDYLQLPLTTRLVLDNPKGVKKSRWKILESSDFVHFGNSHLIAQKEGSKLQFKTSKMPAGKYNVYIWRAGAASKISEPGTNFWEFYGEKDNRKQGVMNVEILSGRKGEVVDAILLKKIETL